MKLDRWMNFFRNHKNKKIFSFSDLVQLTDEDKPALSVQLNRLVESGTIKRAVKGWYENPFNPPDPEELAVTIRYPSYLSMEYALSKGGVLSQNVYILTLITTRSTYTYSYEEKDIEYHQIKKPLFFGYEKKDDVSTADDEKALLDLIYIRYVKSDEMNLQGILSLAEDMYLEKLDDDLLYDYSEKYSRKVYETLKELSFG